MAECDDWTFGRISKLMTVDRGSPPREDKPLQIVGKTSAMFKCWCCCLWVGWVVALWLRTFF